MLSGVTTSWDKLECLISIVHFIKINNHYLLERKLHRSSEMLIFQVCGNSGNLAHLGKLFEMYIGKSYHRPRSTWLDAVYRYINDSYGHLTRSHVTFLLEVGIYILSSTKRWLKQKKSVLCIAPFKVSWNQCQISKHVVFFSTILLQIHIVIRALFLTRS